MKKLFIYSLSAISILAISYSCSDDFLDAKPTEFLTSEQISEASSHNPDVIAGTMKGIYTLMFETGTGGTDLDHDDFGQKGYDIYSDMLCGDMALTVSTYGWYRTGITEFQATTDYTNIANYKPWRYYYRIIRSANTVIDAIGGNDVIPELEENKHILGQAKAIRAYAYFYLTQFFAESYNPSAEILPIYTDPNVPNQPKSTTQEVFDLMIKDLTDAISLLDNFNRSQKNEINKYVAKGLLAYVYGAMDGNENAIKAKDLAFDVINNGGFPIMSADEIAYTGPDDLVGGFNDVNTPGWMWGVDLTSDNGLDLVSWWGQVDAYTYSYQWAGDRKGIDSDLYAKIPATDARKVQFWPTTTSDYYLSPRNKFYDPARVLGGQRTVTTDYVYMRVAEMYLLHAETAARSGDEGAAKSSLKALLNLRLPSTTYVDGLTGQALLNEIYLQTRIELWGEGKSYLAMKRNKATVTRGANHLSNVGIPIPYNDDRLTFEIPQSEVQNNPFIN